ncbi:hypothetical protein ANCCAN_04104 [Ancylostoma caninum]|uniref:Uncharacterized protein n=1 Tax=Ancylostoma caninum TaxID=29170 RepID=A0A368H2L9_ANCCA|nr:hypothetical protein ANCCAN_04104 [Ancylostoma caninum]
MFPSFFAAALLAILLGFYPMSIDAMQMFPFCKELGRYKMRDNIKKIVIGQVSTAEPLRGHLISTTIIYDCVLEGLAVLEMKRRGPANACTSAGQFFTEKFEDTKRAGYKPKQFIEQAVKSFYPTIGKLGVMGKYGCSYATDEIKYKLVCVFMALTGAIYRFIVTSSETLTETSRAEMVNKWHPSVFVVKTLLYTL